MEMAVVYRLAEERMYTAKLEESRTVRTEIIDSIRKSLEAHAHETQEHVNRIKELALKLSARIGLGEYECNKLELLAKIHDIGKIAIPHSILCKPGNLNIECGKLYANTRKSDIALQHIPRIGFPLPIQSSVIMNAGMVRVIPRIGRKTDSHYSKDYFHSRHL